MPKIKVLIFPANGENSYEIYDSLKYCVNLDVFGATSKHDFCEFLYPKEKLFIGNYSIFDEKFMTNFNDLLIKNDIDIVIPTHDTIVQFLTKHKYELKCKLLSADEKTAEICRHKIDTFNLFKEESFCPYFCTNEEKLPKEFPLFLKPNVGEGAKGVKLVETLEDYQAFVANHSDYLVSEYLPGDEYTIDCFTNKDKKLLFVGMRTRENITNGISCRSQTVETQKEVNEIAHVINSKLNMFGAWFFQLKTDKNGKLKLLEVACRQAGTMTLYRNKGVNFALLGIYELMSKNVDIIENKYKLMLDRRLEAKFKFDYEYETVYLDYDDTVIVNEQVNIYALQYIYYCINKKIKVILLSRHNTDHDNSIEEDLDKYKISKNLFDDIISLQINEEKTSYIKSEKAIFIDNSYVERKKVHDVYGIPVFDVDCLPGLIF